MVYIIYRYKNIIIYKYIYKFKDKSLLYNTKPLLKYNIYIYLILYIYINHLETNFVIYIIRKMSGLNLEDLHKKLYNNTIKIRSIEKENKSIMDSIKLVETLNKYDDDKLDNLDLQLKEIVNLQKKMSLELTKKVCEGKKDNINTKYLNLPYDINEIIRNKIKKDSEIQFKINHIDRCFKVIESMFQRKLLHYISVFIKRIYHNPDNSPPSFITNSFSNQWLDLFSRLNCNDDDIDEYNLSWYYWINEFSNIYISNNSKEKTKYLYNYFPECKKHIINKLIDLKQHYQEIKYDIIKLIENIEVDSYNGSSFIKYTTDWSDNIYNLRNDKGRKNGMGYKKLLKYINQVLYDELSHNGLNDGEYIIKEDTYWKWMNMDDWTWNGGYYDVYESNYELFEESCNNKKFWY